MKKFFVVGFLSLLLVGCGKQIQRYSISSLEDLKFAIIHVYVQLKDGDITKEQATEQISYLQKNYGSYFAISSGYFGSGLEVLSGSVRALPVWATELGLDEPTGMYLDSKRSSKTSVQDPKYGFDSFVLVYTGSYDHAMQEAKRITDLAKIPVSPEILMAEQIQASSGIVYANHGLLDTDIDYLITVSVDEQGSLILDVTNYKQIANKSKSK